MLNEEKILLLMRVFLVACKYDKTPRDWQTVMIIPIFKKGDCKQCTNFRGMSLFSLQGKSISNALKRTLGEAVKKERTGYFLYVGES